jgi:heme exporter protein A
VHRKLAAGARETAVEARDVACVRAGRLVFSGLSFRAAAGVLCAVTGPNGSGKSSLLRVLAGLLRPAAGTVTYDGRGEDEPFVHYLGHADALKPTLTLREVLRFWAALFDAQDTQGRCDPSAVAEIVGLAHALDFPTGVLSEGQRRRAGLARLLLAARPLWLLDEPAAALDRDGDALLGRLMAEHLAAGGMIIAATHQPLPLAPHQGLELGAAA